MGAAEKMFERGQDYTLLTEVFQRASERKED